MEEQFKKSQELQDLLYQGVINGDFDGLSLRAITKKLNAKYPQKVKHALEQLGMRGVIMFNIKHRRYKSTHHKHEFRCIWCNEFKK